MRNILKRLAKVVSKTCDRLPRETRTNSRRPLLYQMLERREVLAASATLIEINTAGGPDVLFDKTAVVGDRLFYVDTNVQVGGELHAFRKSTQTVSVVTDINPGVFDSYIGKYGDLTAVGSKLYFTAFDPDNGFELRWIDTSLDQPTVNLISVADGPVDSFAGKHGGFISVGTKLFFSAFDPARGNELRWIDTTLANPIVNTISVATGTANADAGITGFTAVGNKLYFAAADSTGRFRLRWIDTTLSAPLVNTVNIATPPSGLTVGTYGGLVAVGNKLFFTAEDTTFGNELRWIDTTLAIPQVNTVDIDSSPGGSGAGMHGGFAVMGTRLYYSAFRLTTGTELHWIDTALANPTVNTIDVASGLSGSEPGNYLGLTPVGSKLYFDADTQTHGNELRWIDTALGVPVVNTIHVSAGNADSIIAGSRVTVSGDKLYFTATDPQNGLALRWIDTTSASPTVNKINIVTGPFGPDAGRYGGLIETAGTLYFVARDAANNNDLYWFDTNPEPPVLNRVALAEQSASSGAGTGWNNGQSTGTNQPSGGFAVVNEKLYFSATDETIGDELHWIDTSVSLTDVQSLDLVPGVTGSRPGLFGGFISVGSSLYYNAEDPQHGAELRWIDTSLATPSVNTLDIRPGQQSSLAGIYGGFVTVGSKLFFTATDNIHGFELRWIDTSLSVPTLQTIDLNPGFASSFAGQLGGFVVVGSRLFFTATTATHGSELRWIDASLATPIVHTIDINPGTGGSTPAQISGFQLIGNKLFFAATDVVEGRELRWVDTQASIPTVQTVSVGAGADGSFPGQGVFAAAGNKLYFTALDNTNGHELRWIDASSNSPTVQTLNVDNSSGSTYSYPESGFAVVGDRLFFTAFDNVLGSELRFIDFVNSPSVIQTIDFEPGRRNSFPGNFASHGNRLYFAASREADGRELRWLDAMSPTPLINTTFEIASGPDGNARNVVFMGDNLYFNGTRSGFGSELFLASTNSAPTSIALSSSALPENAGSDYLVGTFSTSDLDGDSSFLYQLVPGTGSDDNAAFTIDSAGQLLATQSLDFETQSSFRIRVRSTDMSGGFLERAFIIQVTNVNDAPVGVNDHYLASESLVLSVPVTTGLLSNDRDPDGSLLSVTGINDSVLISGANTVLPSGATLTLHSTGRFTYDPRSAFNYLSEGVSATDIFTYRLSDGALTSDSTVTITIVGTNDAPIASRVNATVLEDGPQVSISASFVDPDSSDAYAFSTDTANTKGNVVNLQDGSFLYDPSNAFETLSSGQSGIDVFRYTVVDGSGGSTTASVVVTVQGQNDAPTARVDTASTFENTAVTVNVLANDLDPDVLDKPATFILLNASVRTTSGLIGSPQAGGTASVVANKLVFTPGIAFDELAIGDTAQVIVDYTMADSGGLTSSSSVTITVNGANDAPSLATGQVVSFPAIQEDAVSNSGVAVAALLQSASDRDRDARLGIAIVGATGAASGNWQYSLNGGSSWLPLGSPTAASARLVSSNGTMNRIRFVPAPHFHGTVQITYRAWDQSVGVDGASVNLSLASSVGGTSAFSAIASTASLQVLPVNDAPVLTSSTTTLASINEDFTNASGTTIASLVLNSVSDADAGALRGIALIGLSNSASGTWQFTLDGGVTWRAIVSASSSSARLLPSNASLSKIRFVPAANFSGTVMFHYRAWDQTQGVAGEAFNLSGSTTVGASTAFSVAIGTASLIVQPVNDAPVLSATAPMAFPSIAEDTASPSGATVASLLIGRVSDADLNSLSGIAVVGATGTSTGVWQWTIDGGLNWQALGSPTTSAARLIQNQGNLTKVRYVPLANFNGTVRLIYRAWDQTSGLPNGTANLSVVTSIGNATAFSAVQVTASLTVTPVNDAPVLINGSLPKLLPILEDNLNSPGTTIASLIAGAFSDLDLAPKAGIAITSAGGAASGVWQYTLDGGTLWQNLGTPTATSAFLLPSNAGSSRLRFVPNANFNGNVVLRFHGWDQTQGIAAGTFNISTSASRGGSTAFSIASVSTTLAVTPVNDAPVLTNTSPKLLGTIRTIETNPLSFAITQLLSGLSTDADAGALRGIAVIGTMPSSGGRWWYTFNNVSWFAIEDVSPANALLLPSNARLQFIPTGGFVGTATLRFRSWDQTMGSPQGRVNIGTNALVGGVTAFSSGIGTATINVVA